MPLREKILTYAVGSIFLTILFVSLCSSPEKEAFPHSDLMHSPTEKNPPAPEPLSPIPIEEMDPEHLSIIEDIVNGRIKAVRIRAIHPDDPINDAIDQILEDLHSQD